MVLRFRKLLNFLIKLSANWSWNFHNRRETLKFQIEALVIAMIDLDESKFEKIFNTAVINYGFEETILKLIYPFFSRVWVFCGKLDQ